MTTFKDVGDYLNEKITDFEIDGDEGGCYSPNASQRLILEYFVAGLSCDDEFADLVATAFKWRSDERAAHGVCRGCGAPKGEHWGQYVECARSDREQLTPGRDHLTVYNEFKSDKYPWCPVGFVPLKVTDPMAYEPLLQYLRRRSGVDVEFSRDLQHALDYANVNRPRAGIFDPRPGHD